MPTHARRTSTRLRTYAYGLVTTTVVLLFTLAETGTEKFVSDRSRIAGTALEIAIVLLAALAFRPLHQHVEGLVEAAFTKRRREARDALTRLKKELTSFNDPHQVMRRVVEGVDHHMGTAGCAIYVRRGDYVAEASSFDVAAPTIEAGDPLIVRLRSKSAPADPRALNSGTAGELAFPMMAAGDLVGFLTVLPKRVEFDAEDTHLLGLLAESLGVALTALDASLRGRSGPRTNLPRAATSFVGRETEIAEIQALVRAHGLVTLTGAGGVGKTRTALQAAGDLLGDFHDGVWLVELAPLSSGDHIASTIAAAMHVPPARNRDPLEALIGALEERSALIVLDNCEHVIGGATGVVAAILRGCPNVKLLVTSRQGLAIPEEQTYRLPSLDVSPATMLFFDRARAADKRFALSDANAGDVAEICRRLDGIPLAIELAASKAAVLTPRQLLERLNERFRLLAAPAGARLPRQQTLRAMIDWSYDMLDARERSVFARLSVFAGGWNLKAAEAVCAGDGIDDWQVFELLSSLVSKSLVVAEPDGDELRYEMLQSIREYSAQRLAEAGEAAETAAKHARHYSSVVCDAVALVETLDDERWQHALVPELDNVRAALDWSLVRRQDVDAGLRAIAALEWPELLTTPIEAIGWFDRAVTLLAGAADVTKARILRQQVRLAWFVGRPVGQREKTAEEALAAARGSGNRDEIARALASRATCYRDAGRFAEAEPLFEQAYREHDELSAIALNEILRNWAVTDLQHGDLEAARRRFTEVAQRERPGSEAHASAYLNLGELEFAAGNVAAARAAARTARESLIQLRAAPLALAECNLAAYAMSVDDFEDARTFLREALETLKKSGSRWLTMALEHHAVFAGLSGDFERAAALLGFTDARLGSEPRQVTERHGYERLMAVLGDVYDPKELAQRLSAGASMSEEQALARAAAISASSPPVPDPIRVPGAAETESLRR